MAKVLISDKISESAIQIFKNNKIEVDYKPGISEDELNSIIHDYDGLAIRSATKVTESIIEKAEKLKVIGRAGIGTDNIDKKAATKKGIIVMNTPFGNAVTTAEHAIALMMSLVRMIPSANESTQLGKWEKSSFNGVEVTNKIFGLIGCGNIGSIVASRAIGLKMKVLAFDPFLKEEKAKELGVKKVDLDELLKLSDVISLHTPLTDETKNIISADAINKMKKGSRLINCARGGLVDENACRAALENNHLAGAAFDVFVEEPAHNNVLFNAPNFIATPHLGASTKEAKDSVSISICNQVKNYLINEELNNALNIPFQNFSKLKKMEPILNLSALLGSIHSQVASGPIKEVEINCFGKVKDTKPIGFSFIRSLLQSRVPERVNYINANVIAKELGIKININYSSNDTNYTNLISAIVRSDDEYVLEGSIFDDNLPRLVNIFGYKMEVNPNGTLLFIHNKDVPGVIGKVGSLLGSHNINIAAYLLSRDKHKKLAFAVIRLDQEISSKVIVSLKNMDELKFVRQISINKKYL